MDLLRTQKNEAEAAVRSHEEELDQKSEFAILYLMFLCMTLLTH